MQKPFSPSQPDIDRFAQRVDELRQALRSRDPAQMAAHTGAALTRLDAENYEFRLAVWDRPVRLAFPALTAHPGESADALPSFQLALLLYYFAAADGEPLTHAWISFADLPDGRFYNQAFQGYTGKELARSFGNDLAAFEQAAHKLGGVRQPLGDAAFAFLALPRAPVLAVYWQGDDEFPASCQVLFDASASHYLPTDGYAILGSTLTSRLIKARGNEK